MHKCRVPCSRCLLLITSIVHIFVYSRCMLKIELFVIKDRTCTQYTAHGTRNHHIVEFSNKIHSYNILKLNLIQLISVQLFEY
jgi:hypothetical protein